MSSERTSTAPPSGSAQDRILVAAVDLFGRRGLRSTTLKAVAEQAGVSPALVVHHFGSKAGLRTACDRRLAERVRSTKGAALRRGAQLHPGGVLAQIEDSRPLLRYLARAVVEPSPEVDELIDELIADALDYTAAAEADGQVRPSADPRARMVVLTVWSLGALVLHEQLERLLDVDLLDEGGDVLPYLRAAVEIFTQGVLTHDAVVTEGMS
ncbi:TetR family transcriptional regulator [Ornithinimicrobium avium]|uniref:TetR/AcrR family transcriptional regulator n=1 Tax=Ornithinimicrobium avium TaxID=2283195 RepID=A0A345NQI7_9MICO|nr:TetR family transcriptional regulator [Ornithinimicrobium avium]AXH97295.1 TetR/AcrR family transcriptional regulator [Ornithinimicrobium avium]